MTLQNTSILTDRIAKDTRENQPCAHLPKVSIVIVNTNELHHLKRLLPSLVMEDYPHYEILLVDNNSTDGSLTYVEKNFPHVRIIRSQQNLGYAGGNNIGFRHATGAYVAVLNPDTRAEPGWLRELISALENEPDAGLATPKILLMDNPETINACGNQITFSGLTYCRGLGQPATDYSTREVVSAVSGAAFVIRKDTLEEMGGFDQRFFVYYEETDLSLRAMLAGYHCLYVPTAIIYHQYAFRFSPKKAFWQERNRYFALLKTLDWRTFVALFPALLLGEIIAWGYSILKGREHIGSKVKAYLWIFTHRREILEARRHTQQLRQVRDREILEQLTSQIKFTQTTHPLFANLLEKIFNPLLFLTGKVGLTLVRW